MKLFASLILAAGAALVARPVAAQQAAPATTSTTAAPSNKQAPTDFGWLTHFQDANAKLPPPAPGENRVVFMGDSITDFWPLSTYFPGKPYINRGISGQTTPQMLLRFRQDVIDLHPKVVILLAGTNDIAGNTGPMTIEQTEGNLESMAELAAASGIRVVLCSITPVAKYPWRPEIAEPAEKIMRINAWLKDYAAQKGFVYVDYHSAMKDAENGLPLTLSKDGVHPQPAGYAVMAPLAEVGIDKALAQ